MWLSHRQEKNNKEKNCKENQEKEIVYPRTPVAGTQFALNLLGERLIQYFQMQPGAITGSVLF